ncbi:MAG: alpha/beta fold hydrolase, partial [Deltaproteobacteria bacterium]|nr:alpha/beta fold hydrolase [Deltaproteobacteria bacterium]
KDRRTLDHKGKYSIYSRSEGERRKHHTGPAVIALALAVFKSAVRKIEQNKDSNTLSGWAKELGFNHSDELVKMCHKPTLIIPCNITFYPLRVGDNLLKDGVQFFYKDLHKRLSEELLIEGNFLLKNTDMDIQIGTPIVAEDYWTRIESILTTTFIDYSELSLSDIFNRTQTDESWDSLLFRLSYQRNALKIRNAYMHEIYTNVTINIAHIAATIIMHYVKKGHSHINKQKLHELVYLSIKELQQDASLNFHRTVLNPAIYRNLLMTKSETFDQFLRGAYKSNLLESSGTNYKFTENITLEHDFDAIRYKNPMAVYANEVSPIPKVEASIKASLDFHLEKQALSFANKLLDDELREYEWDLAQFQGEDFNDINQQQKIDRAAALPYILLPKRHNGECIVLVHGLLSTPAEMRRLGNTLYELGYIVIGTRLKGHGTSPWDLHQRTWQDWQQSLRQSIKIAHCYSKKVHLIGFSSGSLLALLAAANQSLNISSVVACSTPAVFKDPLIHLVKAASYTNKLIQSLSWSEGVHPLMENTPEHPHLNYQHTPVHAIHQLLLLIEKTKPKLKKLTCPVLFLQGDNDPVVDKTSMGILLKSIKEPLRDYQWVNSNRHGILHENTDNCQQRITDFILAQNK